MTENLPIFGDFDVLIAGAGGMGMLTARELDRRGYSCAVVDPLGIAAEQTGHSHGYLHRGYIYLRTEEQLVRNLRKATDRWKKLMEPEDVVMTTSLVGFADALTCEAAVRSWDHSGLPRAEEAKLPPFIRGTAVRRLFETKEPVILANRLLARMRGMCRRTAEVVGRVDRLLLDSTTCEGAVVIINDQPARIRARYTLLCAGAANAGIINRTIGIYRAASALRTSFMLVVRGELPPLSLILPEQRFNGLFLATRRHEDEVIWLVSNFVSFGGRVDVATPVAARWARDMIEKLDRVFRLPTQSLRYGIYRGLKAEFRRDPERMPDDRIVESFGLRNVGVSWPTKLTLAPALATKLAQDVHRKLRAPDSTFPHEKVQRFRPLPEHWEGTICHSRAKLFEHLGQPHVAI